MTCLSCGAEPPNPKAVRCRQCEYAHRRMSVRRTVADFPPPTPQPTPCRLWQGALDGDGYGTAGARGRIHRWVVRTAGEDQFGVPFSDDLEVMHLCDHPLCYRFDHLRLGTTADNHHDALDKGRKKPTTAHLRGMKVTGEDHPNHKLTAAQVAEIRQRLDNGDVGRHLADEFGVSTSTISAIRKGHRWK